MLPVSSSPPNFLGVTLDQTRKYPTPTAPPKSKFLSATILAILGFVTLTTGGLAKEPKIARPESVGMSSERLARIRPVLGQYVERGEVPGFVTLIARHGKIVHYEAHGRRVIEDDEPMPRDAIFDLASMTKPITAIAALILYERGAISLTDPIHKFLPDFADTQVETDDGLVPANRPIRIRDLFTHTSGIDEPWDRHEMAAFGTLANQMRETAKLPLKNHPGEAWRYGDSFNALSYLVEVVSGQRFDRFLQDELLTPLGMVDTHFWLPQAKEGRRAMVTKNGKSDLASRYSIERADEATYFRGASGLHATALDYWRFCQMLLNGGQFDRVRYLSPTTVDWIAHDHAVSADMPFPPNLGFGLGFAVALDQGGASDPRGVGSFWWGGSQGTAFWIDPVTDLVAVLMVQTSPHRHLAFHEQFAALTYAAIVEPSR